MRNFLNKNFCDVMDLVISYFKGIMYNRNRENCGEMQEQGRNKYETNDKTESEADASGGDCHRDHAFDVIISLPESDETGGAAVLADSGGFCKIRDDGDSDEI